MGTPVVSVSLREACQGTSRALDGAPRLVVLLRRVCSLPVCLPSARLLLPVSRLSLRPPALPRLPSHLGLLAQVLGAAAGRL